MSIYKKNIIILLLLDIAYLILSANIIISPFIPGSVTWYTFVPFVMILALGGYGLFVYRRQSNTVLTIANGQYTFTRVLTFAFLMIYVVQMIVVQNPEDNPSLLSILVGGFLTIISLTLLILHVRVLLQKTKK